MSQVFSFIDATHLIAKANLWEARDKVVAKVKNLHLAAIKSNINYFFAADNSKVSN